MSARVSGSISVWVIWADLRFCFCNCSYRQSLFFVIFRIPVVFSSSVNIPWIGGSQNKTCTKEEFRAHQNSRCIKRGQHSDSFRISKASFPAQVPSRAIVRYHRAWSPAANHRYHYALSRPVRLLGRSNWNVLVVLRKKMRLDSCNCEAMCRTRRETAPLVSTKQMHGHELVHGATKKSSMIQYTRHVHYSSYSLLQSSAPRPVSSSA